MNTCKIHLIIADDHELVREGIALLLQNEPSIERIDTAASGEEVVNLATTLVPDVVLLDLNMQGYGGIESARKILQLEKNIKIIIISSFNATAFPLRLMEIGAHGYLYKDISKADLLKAITTVYAGHSYLDPRIARTITIDRFSEHEKNPFNQLTIRELQVAMLLIHSIPAATISDYLCISPKAVCGYRYTLFDKLKIDSDVELTQLAYKHQLLTEILPTQEMTQSPL